MYEYIYILFRADFCFHVTNQGKTLDSQTVIQMIEEKISESESSNENLYDLLRLYTYDDVDVSLFLKIKSITKSFLLPI